MVQCSHQSQSQRGHRSPHPLGPQPINFEPNERAEEAMKKVVLGESSPAKDLPAFLCKPLPLSISALHQESKTKIHRLWSQCWKNSPHYANMFQLDKSTPSNKWLVSVQPLNCKEASVIMQLHTGHIALNKHLHRIHHSPSPICPNCNDGAEESVFHFLFICNCYNRECVLLCNKLH